MARPNTNRTSLSTGVDEDRTIPLLDGWLKSLRRVQPKACRGHVIDRLAGFGKAHKFNPQDNQHTHGKK